MVTVLNRGVPADEYGSPFFWREYTRTVIFADLTKSSNFFFHARRIGQNNFRGVCQNDYNST